MGLSESTGIQLFGIEDDRTDPVKGLKVVKDYIRGFVRAFNFNFGGTDSFHYKVPLYYSGEY